MKYHPMDAGTNLALNVFDLNDDLIRKKKQVSRQGSQIDFLYKNNIYRIGLS